jgi:hypothetical protein
MITPPYQITKHQEYRKEISVSLMKTCNIRISVLSIAFSLIFLVVSSVTKAETQDEPRKGLAAELHLESARLLVTRSHSVNSEDLKNNPLRGFLIPLKEGLSAFIDCAPPPHQDGLTPKDAGTNYRAVIGLHFSLR